MDTTIFFKGLLLGYVIAAPTGPIGILCARRVLTHGRRAAFASGMGAATADVIYGFIAAFGLSYIAHLLDQYSVWLRLAGGVILCYIGVRTLRQPVDSPPVDRTGKLYAGLFTATFFLTLTNPMTILSFGAVFAGFGVAAGTKGSVLSAAVLVAGVFLGSALWWLFLIGLFTLLKDRIGQHQVQWINRVAGVVIGGSGVLALLTLLF